MRLLEKALRAGERRRISGFEKRINDINAREAEVEALSDDELRQRYDQLRQRAADDEHLDDLLDDCFALVREVSRRQLGLRHYDVQLFGAMALAEGRIAEMKTGEGKTLTATLAVCLWALAGRGVHVVTVNDYLARRDAEWMGPIYRALGLSVGVIQSGHDADRRQAYQCDITYGTNSEFGFDYLRDNLALGRSLQVQRGRAIALVDEVDNILIDEARTPLIISGQSSESPETYRSFARLAQIMEAGKTPEGLDPRAKKEFVADFDYEFDEKHKTVAVSEQGVAKAEQFLGIEHLYQAEHGALVNHLQQALRAQSLYRRDRDYAVIDGEVVIIDEFTGRTMEGRRWSDGLHQAVEAKEGVAISEESQTVASITYQNYFRLYETLAGMTGTALTEAVEFKKIYDLEVVEVPTHLPVRRLDRPDRVFATQEGKWHAVAEEIKERHGRGQPILVGTISVEASELLSARLKRAAVPHTVLNAKPEHAEREGRTIAHAGLPGAVTIATNMAGRGVDIKLGGNPEELARHQLAADGIDDDDERFAEAYQQALAAAEARLAHDRQAVEEAGGLLVIGTERHEARRIDNQLRGRSGRQGDPGESIFYLSGEDDLIRLFAGNKIFRLLDSLQIKDDDGHELPLENKLLSKQIARAQSMIEEQHYLSRKHVLEYDDVLGEQRRIIYGWREDILDETSLDEVRQEQIQALAQRLVEEYVGDYIEETDLDGLVARLAAIAPPFVPELLEDEPTLIAEQLATQINQSYQDQFTTYPADLVARIEGFILLQIIDENWQAHLADMDYLREGIHLRGFAQIEPLVAYKHEAFDMFAKLVETIWEEFLHFMMHIEISDDVLDEHDDDSELLPPAPAATPIAATASPGRNQPCWCGSGKKFKKCHGA